jgi:PAT family beta-lactamase induction signal transducer AmpG
MTHPPINMTGRLILSESKRLRFITVCIFYLNQGVGLGFFGFVLPAWLAANGATIGQIATVVSVTALPWSLKFVNGLLIDRYTFLPMGRRRIWIVGAQIVMVAMMIIAAVLSPQPSDIALLATLGFGVNLAIAFQDVGVDALAIDIMKESERAKGAGMMFGSQTIGMAITVVLAGWLIDSYGFSSAIISLALLPAATILYGLVIIERVGEKHLPWGAGQTHPSNSERQVKAWAPLLCGALRAIFVPVSLLVIPLLVIRTIATGATGVFGPTLFTTYGGWSTTSFTNFVSLVAVMVGVWGLLFSGKIVEKFGEKSVIAVCSGSICILFALFAALPVLWSEKWFLVSFVIVGELLSITVLIAVIPICMRLCLPAFAATQFVIYMSITNLGTLLGAFLARVTAGQGYELLLFWVLALFMAFICVWSIFAKSLYGASEPQKA